MRKKLSLALCFVFIISLIFSFTVSALDHNSYYYDYSGKAHEAPSGYSLKKSVLFKDLGVENTDISDIATDKSGNIYFLSSKTGEILVLDSAMNYARNIVPIFSNEDNCVGAQGFFLYENKNAFFIYIADTAHSRIVKLDADGNILKIYYKPKTTLIADKTEFNPIKLVVNESGSVFVLCQGIYSGAVIMNDEGDFLGFYGSNKIKITAAVLYDSFWKSLFGSSRGDVSRYVPIEFSNLTIDDKGFIYTITASKADDTGIKYLNYSGSNLFPEKTYGDLENLTSSNKEIKSSFVDIAFLGEGIISVLDVARNRVFLYNNSGDLLTVFGGQGNYKDMFNTPSAIASYNDEIYVYDAKSYSLSLFSPNAYGKDLLLASRQYAKGQYEESYKTWQSILEQNNGLQTAYISIGRTLVSQNKYTEAMKYFELGNSKENYSEAKAGYRKQILQKWFLLIFIVLIALISSVFLLLSKKQIKKKNEILKAPATLSYAVFHPIKAGNTFVKSGTVISKGLLLIVLPVWFLSNIISTEYSGFIFNTLEEHPLDLRVEFIATFIVGLTFVLANWLIVTMTEGNGRLTEIATVVGIALIPYVAGKLLATFLSNIMLIDEGMIVNAPVVLCSIWMAVILVNGLAKIHEFTILGAVKNILFTIFGMFAIAFLLLLEVSILKQIQVLFKTIIDELIMLSR